MAHAFLKLVNGGKSDSSKKKGSPSGLPNLSHLLSTSQPKFSAASVPNTSMFDSAPKKQIAISLDLNSTNNLDFFASRQKRDAKPTTQPPTIEDSTSKSSSKRLKERPSSFRAIPLPTSPMLQQLQQKHAILVDGEDKPMLLPTFELIKQEYPLPDYISSNLTAALVEGGFGFSQPTPIQMQTIPALMNRRDVMAFAPTGSGKTLAFALPMVQHLFLSYLNTPHPIETKPGQNDKIEPNQQQPKHSQFALPIHALILCPTRELALQTHRVYKKLLRKREEYFMAQEQASAADPQTDSYSDFHPQAILLTKRWKTRCTASFQSYLQNGKGDAQDDKKDDENSDSDDNHDDNDNDNDDDDDDDDLTQYQHELQDEDDDGVDHDIMTDSTHEKNKRKSKTTSVPRKLYNIVVATPMLLLSLLDRCSRLMKQAFAHKYQQYFTAQWEQSQQIQSTVKYSKKNPQPSIPSSPPAIDLEHLDYPKVLGNCTMLVLDECDRLLDLGFLQQVNSIMSHSQRVHPRDSPIAQQSDQNPATAQKDADGDSTLSLAEKKKLKILSEKKKLRAAQEQPKRAHSNSSTTSPTLNSSISDSTRMITVLVSATITPSITVLSSKMLTMPIKVTIGEENVAQLSIKQKLMYCMNEDGKKLGIKQIIGQGLSMPMLVFLQSKERTMQLYEELQYTFQSMNSSASESLYDSIHGNNKPTTGPMSSTKSRQNSQQLSRIGILHSDLPEHERLATITRFRIGELWILLCTDVISRGLDFVHVKCVVNYDFPSSTTSYLHRIGRTGRGGYKGTAVTFVTDEDQTLLPNVAQIVKHSEELQWCQEKEEFCEQQRKKIVEKFQGAIDAGEMMLQDVYLNEQYLFYNDIDNIQADHRLFVAFLAEKKKLGLIVDDFETSGVAAWMLELRSASAQEQQRLLFKQPIRDDIVPTSTGKHEKYKKQQMDTFHKKKMYAEKLGIVTRNEVGTRLSDKLDTHGKKIPSNGQIAQENMKKNATVGKVKGKGDVKAHTSKPKSHHQDSNTTSSPGAQKRKKMVGFRDENDYHEDTPKKQLKKQKAFGRQ